ncbi:MAG: hypothetical protein VB086_09835 [Clostridiaceae bacterium]|nr:hypothetical protein [Clostridiaceae bacterium]
MKKRILFLLTVCTFCLLLSVPTLAASKQAMAAADKLNDLGLFTGVGTNADGTSDYDLDRVPNRAEAVTLLIRLLGKEEEAKGRSWATPFTDVADWAKPYVGYAYAHDLTSGISPTTFGSSEPTSAAQYLTFVLRALGYTSGADFRWDSAWEFTDKLGISNGQYNTFSHFTRGDAAVISEAALHVNLKNQSKTLMEAITENRSEVDQWTIRGTIALPDGFTHYGDISGFCYAFGPDERSISAYFLIPSGARDCTFEFHVPAKPGAAYDFLLEVHTDCGLVQNGLILGKDGSFALSPVCFILTNEVTDLGTYVLQPALKLSGTIRLPADGAIAGEYISGFVRAHKPGESNGPQARFELYATAGSTSFSIAVPDEGPYQLSVYLGVGESNLYTGELYQKAEGLLPGWSQALSFYPGDRPEIVLRRGFTVRGAVTLPVSAAGPCCIEVFAHNDGGIGNSIIIYNLRPGESAPFRFSLLSPNETLRFGYRLWGSPGTLLADQAIYTDGITYSADFAAVQPLDISKSEAFLTITPVAQLS